METKRQFLMVSLLNVLEYFIVYFEVHYQVTSKTNNIQYILLINKLKSKEQWHILATFRK